MEKSNTEKKRPRLIEHTCKDFSTTVILSSHNLSFVADISTRILLLEKGLIVKDLPNADGAAKAELNEYFGMENEEKPADTA